MGGQLVVTQDQDSYYSSRADAMHTIESTIVELGGIFSQLATMVKEQEEMVQRIDSNVDDTALNVELGHNEILKYFQSVTSNRWLMIKIFDKDGSSNPDRVLPLRWSNDFDLDGGWSKSSDLLLHTVSNTRVHGGSSRHDSVGIQVLADVYIALHDGVVCSLVDATGFHAKEGRLEESLRAAETLVANGDDLTIRKFVRLLKRCGSSCSGHFLFEVKGNIAELLLDITDNLTLSSGGEGVATLCEDLHQVVGELTSSKIKTNNSMGESITFINWDTMRDTISRVHDNTSGTARGIEGEDSLDGHVHSGHVEGLKHDLGHLLTVSLGVEGSLSEEDRLFLRGNTEFIVEGVVPDLLHIIPVGNDSVF